jgi:hypothetical protein
MTTPVTPDERRPIGPAIETVNQFGRTRRLMECPFCQAHVWGYLWSLAGSGKKCPCGVLLTMSVAIRRA